MKQDLIIRPIVDKDDPEVEKLIQAVMTEHGACGAGFAIHDPEVKAMSKFYRSPMSKYYVVTDGVRILGGGGFAPLAGEETTTCEIRKMYFYPEARGKGAGRRLLSRCLEEAKRAGFQRVYLETLKSMEPARKLYEKMGFTPLNGPLGNTGHFGCNHWYAMPLGG